MDPELCVNKDPVPTGLCCIVNYLRTQNTPNYSMCVAALPTLLVESLKKMKVAKNLAGW